MALLDEVVAYLVSRNVGTFGTDLFIGHEPIAPSNVVTIYPTGGRPPSADRDKEYPSMQVRVRNISYVNGFTKATDILSLLHKEENYLTTTRGRCYTTQSSPSLMGRGENGEFIFVQNYYWLVSNYSSSSSSSSSTL